MKISRNIVFLLLLFLTACKKDPAGITETLAVNVVNAIVNGGTVKVKLGADTSFSYAGAGANEQITSGTGRFFSAMPGQQAITVASGANPSTVFFDGTLSLSSSVSTLYLWGQLPNIDTMLREEPVLPSINKNVVAPDSLLYIRFANICVNSTPVTIRVNTGIEVSGLAYKGVSEYKSYPAKVSDGVRLPNQSPSDLTRYYMIEVSNAANTVIATYNVSIPLHRFRTLSFVLRGSAGTTGATAPTIFPVIYFN